MQPLEIEIQMYNETRNFKKLKVRPLSLCSVRVNVDTIIGDLQPNEHSMLLTHRSWAPSKNVKVRCGWANVSTPSYNTCIMCLPAVRWTCLTAKRQNCESALRWIACTDFGCVQVQERPADRSHDRPRGCVSATRSPFSLDHNFIQSYIGHLLRSLQKWTGALESVHACIIWRVLLVEVAVQSCCFLQSFYCILSFIYNMTAAINILSAQIN